MQPRSSCSRPGPGPRAPPARCKSERRRAQPGGAWRRSFSASALALGRVRAVLMPRSRVAAFLLHASLVSVFAHEPLAAGTRDAPRRHVPPPVNRRASRRREEGSAGRSPLAAVLQARRGGGGGKPAVDSRVVDRGIAAVLVLRNERVTGLEVDVAPAGGHSVEVVVVATTAP